ncbi:MAG: DUF6666 family protein, partial [Pirellulales bacterium]
MIALSANSIAKPKLWRWHAPMQVYLLRGLLLTLLCSVCGSLAAQSGSSIRQSNASSSKPIVRKLPKSKAAAELQLADSSDLAVSTNQIGSTSKLISNTKSIVQPAAYEELVIPNVMNSSKADGALGILDAPTPDAIELTECDAGPGAYSMYDYVKSDKSAGRHYFLLDWSRADLWVGTSSFVNPAGAFTNNAGATIGQVQGSFGFQEGFNFGSQLPSLLSGQIGSQFGMRFIQSNLEGSTLSTASRNQMFLTAGLFRRVDYGFQGGAVVDYFHQQWIERVDLLQVRGELSFLFSPVHELGFRFTENGRNSVTSATIPNLGTTVTARSRTLDTYRFFARRRFGACSASMVEVHLGTSSDGGVVMGALLQNPLTGQLGLESS